MYSVSRSTDWVATFTLSSHHRAPWANGSLSLGIKAQLTRDEPAVAATVPQKGLSCAICDRSKSPASRRRKHSPSARGLLQ
ncbi:hypothetical protein CBM2608_A50046 [Cupriavidus taiwanensis]|nr:hypothetical protein CBM2608_A50046 [Cupriavidus taiwanensis]